MNPSHFFYISSVFSYLSKSDITNVLVFSISSTIGIVIFSILATGLFNTWLISSRSVLSESLLKNFFFLGETLS